jgi:thioesterase domain-containing protein
MELNKEQMIDFLLDKVKFVKRMGLRVIDLEPCYVKFSAPFEGNENHIDTVYAGALFTLAEVPGGAICWMTFNMENFYPIVKEMTLKFKRPARTDVTIEVSLPREEADRVEVEAAQNGKAEFILEGEIKDTAGDVVAISRGVYQIRSTGK